MFCNFGVDDVFETLLVPEELPMCLLCLVPDDATEAFDSLDGVGLW